MSRTPTMTAADAESILGARGNLSVTADNRATLKKWLSAKGVKSALAARMNYADMSGAYNDITDQCIKVLLAEGKEMPAEQVDLETEEESPVITPPAATQPAPDIAAALGALRTLFGASAMVDESKVIEIMRRELPNLIPVTRLEIVTLGVVKNHGEKRIHKAFKEILQATAQNIPVMMVGPAGSGKSTIAEQVADALEVPFFVEGAMDGAHKITGYTDGMGRYQTTAFRQAYEHGGLYCWEEADNTDPSAATAYNNALANGHMTFSDNPKPIARHEKFRMIGCANTYCLGADRVYVGRNQLDGASIDRFVFSTINYDEVLEKQLAGNDDWVSRVQALRRGAEQEKARIIISPRASIYGAKLLAAGIDRSRVEDMTIWKGADSELRRRIETRARS
jgi:cobaltochelatase CobS